ncbi:MAG: hypothetical protein WDZ76_01680 [Pseudohongiellaceae bacterium]
MKAVLAVVCFSVLQLGCQSLYEDDGISQIRTRADVAAYNAGVSSESEKLVCTREFVVGSNIRQYVCLTAAQRERLARQAQADLEYLTNR